MAISGPGWPITPPTSNLWRPTCFNPLFFVTIGIFSLVFRRFKREHSQDSKVRSFIYRCASRFLPNFNFLTIWCQVSIFRTNRYRQSSLCRGLRSKGYRLSNLFLFFHLRGNSIAHFWKMGTNERLTIGMFRFVSAFRVIIVRRSFNNFVRPLSPSKENVCRCKRVSIINRDLGVL